jgi:hypothetical protein
MTWPVSSTPSKIPASRPNTVDESNPNPFGFPIGISVCLQADRPSSVAAKVINGGVLRSLAYTRLALFRFSERLSESFSGGLDELGIAYDLIDLGSRAVATHVVFLEYCCRGTFSSMLPMMYWRTFC